MAKAYFIGGTPRVGKTTLTLRFLKERPILATSADAIRYTIRQIINEKDEPDLFHLGKYTSNDPRRREYIKNNPDAAIKIQNNESLVVWRSIDNFVKSNLADGFDVLIEGTAILPKFLHDVDYEHRAIFLGNQSKQHKRTILQAARANPNDWMHLLEDETIEASSIFYNKFSTYVVREADKYGYTYLEVHDDNFSNDIESALTHLLQD